MKEEYGGERSEKSAPCFFAAIRLILSPDYGIFIMRCN